MTNSRINNLVHTSHDAVNSWVNIRDELPPPYFAFLAYLGVENVMTAYRSNPDSETIVNYDGDEIYPTHWMIMPKLPNNTQLKCKSEQSQHNPQTDEEKA